MSVPLLPSEKLEAMSQSPANAKESPSERRDEQPEEDEPKAIDAIEPQAVQPQPINDGVLRGMKEESIPPEPNFTGGKKGEKADVIQRVKVEPDHRDWAQLMDMYDKHDENRIKNAKEDIDNLLVFAGLFSAVIFAFVLETYRGLQADPSDTTNLILLQLSYQLASLHISSSFINSTNPAFISPSQSVAARQSSIVVNTLWFFGLAINLITASLGILVKQWLNEFMTQEVQNPKHRVRVRFFRSDGLDRWQVFEIAAALPVLLQIALLLFFIGLNIFLRELNPVVGWATSVPFFGWLLIFVFTAVAPAFSAQCPYKTPFLKRPLQFLRPWIQCLTSWIGLLLSNTWTTIDLILHILFDTVSKMVPGVISKVLSGAISKTVLGLSGYSPLSEDDVIGGLQDHNISLDIIMRSDFLFRDEQARSMLAECAEGVDVCKIMQHYDGNIRLEANDTKSGSQPTTRAWRFTRGFQTRAEDIVRYILLYRSENPGSDTSWFDAVISIVRQKRVGKWWNDLPIFLTQLIRSNSVHGASNALLGVLASYSEDEFSNSITLADLDQNFASAQAHGDSEYLESLIGITTIVFRAFWGPPPPQTSAAYSYVQTVRESKLKVDLEGNGSNPEHARQSVALPFLRSLSSLLLLVSPDVPNTQLEGLRGCIKNVWDKLPPKHWTSLPTHSSFIELIHMGICGGSQVPFQALCSLASQESFEHFRMYVDSLRQEDSIQYLDNLISITNSLMSCLKSPTTEGVQTKPNLDAFCYSFSILLNLSSKTAITKRKRQLRGLTLEILELLNRDSAEFFESATRITYRQLLWSAFPAISANKCKGAITRGLLPKLDMLQSSVRKKFWS